MLELKNPDFVTAMRVVDAINAYAASRYGTRVGFERDFRTIALAKPVNLTAPRFIAEIGELLVEPDSPARVVIDERTGTVVIGRDVQISTVAVTHGNLTVRVTETPVVSQPAPFSRGETREVPRTFVDANADAAGRSRSSAAPTCSAGRGPEPDRPEADRHHRHPAGDQVGRRAAGGTGHPIAGRLSSPAQASPSTVGMKIPALDRT